MSTNIKAPIGGKNTRKYYYVTCDVGEGVPSYDFVIRAKNLEEAERIGGGILKTDYPENWEYNKNSYAVYEVTAKTLLNRMVLN